jgi:multidrug/hemolysin transport system permease protein
MTIVNTLLNTLIGFLAGLYFPLGYLSEKVAIIIKVFPLSHAASMFRKILMESSLKQVFYGVSPQITNQIRSDYGIDLVVGKHVLSTYEMLINLMVFGLIFYLGSAIILKRSKSN